MTTDRKLQNALKHLQTAMKSLASAKKRKKARKKNPCKGNPRVHFPKTRRGRKPVTRHWTITQKGRPPLRFKATKPAAYARAKKLASKSKRLVLDGPK